MNRSRADSSWLQMKIFPLRLSVCCRNLVVFFRQFAGKKTTRTLTNVCFCCIFFKCPCFWIEDQGLAKATYYLLNPRFSSSINLKQNLIPVTSASVGWRIPLAIQMKHKAHKTDYARGPNWKVKSRTARRAAAGTLMERQRFSTANWDSCVEWRGQKTKRKATFSRNPDTHLQRLYHVHEIIIFKSGIDQYAAVWEIWGGP